MQCYSGTPDQPASEKMKKLLTPNPTTYDKSKQERSKYSLTFSIGP
jgi:hypothetical protein